MTLDSFLTKYLGKTKGYPDDTQYLGQCLSIVKLYIKECFGINPPPSGTNSAYGYWSNFPSPLGEVFEKIDNNPDLIPEYGWIVVWKPWTGNIFGHIAIVDKGCTKTTLKNIAQNWTSKVFQRESQSYTNVVGFLRVKNSNNEMITDEQKRILDFIGNRTEGDVREAFGSLADMKQLQDKVKQMGISIEALKQTTETQSKSILDLQDSLVAEQKVGLDYQSQLKSANKRIDEAVKQLEIKEQEIGEVREVSNKYQRLYKEALDKSGDKLTKNELIKLLIKKLWKK